MAVLGVRTTMILVGTLSAGLLAQLACDTLGEQRARWPAIYGAVALPATRSPGGSPSAWGSSSPWPVPVVALRWPPTPADSGRGPPGPRRCCYRARDRWKPGGGPLPGRRRGRPVVAAGVDRRRTPSASRRSSSSRLSSWLFPFSGVQPMGWDQRSCCLALGVAVVLLAPRRVAHGAGRGRRVRRRGRAPAWLVPSPVGTNITRLALVFGGVAAGRPASGHPGRLGGHAAGPDAGPGRGRASGGRSCVVARDVVQHAPAAVGPATLRAARHRLRCADAELGRVEVVPGPRATARRAALAPYVNLARGWNRQADTERNPTLLRGGPAVAGLLPFLAGPVGGALRRAAAGWDRPDRPGRSGRGPARRAAYPTYLRRGLVGCRLDTSTRCAPRVPLADARCRGHPLRLRADRPARRPPRAGSWSGCRPRRGWACSTGRAAVIGAGVARGRPPVNLRGCLSEQRTVAPARREQVDLDGARRRRTPAPTGSPPPTTCPAAPPAPTTWSVADQPRSVPLSGRAGADPTAYVVEAVGARHEGLHPPGGADRGVVQRPQVAGTLAARGDQGVEAGRVGARGDPGLADRRRGRCRSRPGSAGRSRARAGRRPRSGRRDAADAGAATSRRPRSEVRACTVVGRAAAPSPDLRTPGRDG